MLTGADILPYLAPAAAFLIGGGAVWVVASGKIAALKVRADQADRLEQKADDLHAQVQDLLQKNARLMQQEETQASQFENLANRIFQEKSDRFKRESQESLTQLLSPLRDRLNDFQKKVDDSFGAQIKEQVSLKKEIENIIRINQQMTVQTESLTRALKGDVKAQGNWGEVILEKILDDSGLRKGQDYIVQGEGMGLRNADGGQQRPDVIVMLPEDKHIIVDAKVSLTHYERFCAADTTEARTVALKEHLNSIRAHVNGLEKRRYQDTEKLGTPDFVLMFVAVEGAYALAMQEDPTLHSFAWDKKIVIVCPSTLFATLRTIASVWRLELQNRNAEEIARQGGNLYDKIVGFVEDLQQLGLRLDAARGTFDGAMKKLSEGNGNILRRVENLRTLGIKNTKRLPKDMAGQDDDTE